jgi:hypothetical protein
MRTHVVLPDDLVAEIDELFGARQRSKVLTDGARELVRRERLLRAIDAAAGSLKDVDIPGWETPEAADAWIRAGRVDRHDPWQLSPGELAQE